MKCVRCGAPIDEFDQTCPQCGAPVLNYRSPGSYDPSASSYGNTPASYPTQTAPNPGNMYGTNGYNNPAGSYGNPNYGNRQPGYNPSNQFSNMPNPGYGQGMNQPAPGYGRPSNGYGNPSPAASVSSAYQQNSGYSSNGPEQILLRTDGGSRPNRANGRVLMMAGAFFLILGLVTIICSPYTGLFQERKFLIIGIILAIISIPLLVIGRIQQVRAKRFDAGHLVITDRFVEGQASVRQPHETDVFMNPVATRFSIQEIESAGADPDGAYLVVRAHGREYVFATPRAVEAGNIIMDLIRRR